MGMFVLLLFTFCSLHFPVQGISSLTGFSDNKPAFCRGSHAVGDTWFEGCRWCICGEHGTTLCADWSCKAQVKCHGIYPIGTIWKRDECNWCVCNFKGEPSCTYRTCFNYEYSSDYYLSLSYCSNGRRVGETWFKDCKKCQCNIVGRFSTYVECTAADCSKYEHYYPSCSEIEKDYDHTLGRCNLCVCDYTAKLVCQKAECVDPTDIDETSDTDSMMEYIAVNPPN